MFYCSIEKTNGFYNPNYNTNMTGGVKNFKGKRNGFEKNPQNINRKGKSLIGIKKTRYMLSELGYKHSEIKEFEDILLYIIQLSEIDIIELYHNNDIPLGLKVILSELLYSKNSFKLFSDIIDGAFKKQN